MLYNNVLIFQIRYTKKVSMFPVGLVTRLGVSTPIVKNGKVIGFYDGWIAGRKFPVDMAGFAINVQEFLDHPDALMPFSVGYEEDGLLKNLKIKTSDIEPKAGNCTEVSGFDDLIKIYFIPLHSCQIVGKYLYIRVSF